MSRGRKDDDRVSDGRTSLRCVAPQSETRVNKDNGLIYEVQSRGGFSSVSDMINQKGSEYARLRVMVAKNLWRIYFSQELLLFLQKKQI